MSTRCDIITELPDGSYKRIYCHNDGYPDHVGEILHKYYDTQEKVDQLIALGDLSSLGARLSPKGNHSFRDPERGVTVAYHRDREEPLEITQGATIDEVLGTDTDYHYLFKDGAWTCDGLTIPELLKQSQD